MTRLIELDGFTRRWTGTRLPAVYTGPKYCGRCGSGAVVQLPTYTAVPLFRHGGYGEATRIAAEVCLACAQTHVTARQSINPRPLATTERDTVGET